MGGEAFVSGTPAVTPASTLTLLVGGGGTAQGAGGFGELVISYIAPAAPAVPEPGSLALFVGMTLTGTALLRRRKQSQKTR